MRSKPYKHQAEIAESTWHLPAYALWHEQGTGKTRIVLETAERLHRAGKITGLLVVAPPGVHLGWALDECPKHLDAGTFRAVAWDRDLVRTRLAVSEVMQYPGLQVMTISYDQMMTDAGARWAKKFLEAGPRLYCADETSKIKTPGTQRTKRILASAAYAPFRRILNGTPVTDSPFAAYSQLRFLEHGFWERTVGVRNNATFKALFGVWEIRKAGHRQYPHLVDHRNLPLLREVMESIGSTILKDDVLDLPAKIRVTRRFEPSTRQKEMHGALLETYRAEFPDGAEVTAELAIVRLTRLRQIASGFVPADGEPARWIDGPSTPRLEALEDALEEAGMGEGPQPGRQAIVWCQYSLSVDAVMARCRAMDLRAAPYDGRIPGDARRQTVEGFQGGSIDVLVAKPQCGGVGLTLTAATTVIYYENGYSREERLQSEDRAHRIGQTRPVTYIDLLGEDLIDGHVLGVLERKADVAAFLRRT